MNRLEVKALDAIDLDGLINTLCELIRFRSDRGREVQIQHHMAGMLDGMGMATESWEIDLEATRGHPAYGAEIEREQAIGVLGRWGQGQGGRSLLLNGHVDVVPAGELIRWSVPPFRGTVRDGRVYGRGAVDMKGGLCCAVYAVKALMDAGIRLKGSVMIQPVAGEEDGGVGTLAAMMHGHTADGAIVLEPTELAIAPAQAGALSFRLSIPGRAAHGALRTEGVDPLDYFALMHNTLRDLERRRNQRLRHPLFAEDDIPYAICTGIVRAGVWASTVAETLTIEGRYGVGIGEDCAAARVELEQAVAEAAQQSEWLKAHPPEVEWWGARFEPASIPVDHPLVTTLADSFLACGGQPASVRGMRYGADMHLLVNHGNTPAVLFGPGDVRLAHAPDEYVPIADLEAVTRSLVLAIMRFCEAVP